MKYILVEWPDIQEYMELPEYPEEFCFDSEKNVWFIPEWLYNDIELLNEKRL